MTRMKKVLLALLVMLFVVPFLGCGEGNDEDTSAFLRYFQAVPSTNAVDLYLDDTRLVQGATYSPAGASVIQYMDVPTGSHTLRVFPANANPATTTPSLTQAVTIGNGSSTTVLTVGNNSNPPPAPALRLFSDSTAEVFSGDVRVRFINAAVFPTVNPGNANVDVYATGPTDDIANAIPVVSNVAFQSGGYLSPDPGVGTYRIRVTLTGTKTVIQGGDTGAIDLTSAGTKRTFVLVGDGSAQFPVSIAILHDN